MTPPSHHWTLILAGGPGSRLEGWPGPDAAADVPKPYRNLAGDGPLIDGACRRARRLSAAGRTLILVNADHEGWWSPRRARWPRAAWMVQRHDRGTGGAILSAALLILGRDPDGVMTILPADHAVEDEALFVAGLKAARRHLTAHPDALILLAATPEPGGGDDGYGWIVPDEPLEPGLRRVVRFLPRPEPGLADTLRAEGALVDTFLVTATARTLLSLFKIARPDSVDGALEYLLQAGLSPASLMRAQERLPRLDFGADLLSLPDVAPHLLVAPLPACGWADLGTPARVTAYRSRQEARTSG